MWFEPQDKPGLGDGFEVGFIVGVCCALTVGGRVTIIVAWVM